MQAEGTSQTRLTNKPSVAGLRPYATSSQRPEIVDCALRANRPTLSGLA